MITGTQTADGFVPYLNHHSGVDMPVALWVNPSSTDYPQKPQRTSDGDLVFVAPGGGRVTA